MCNRIIKQQQKKVFETNPCTYVYTCTNKWKMRSNNMKFSQIVGSIVFAMTMQSLLQYITWTL